jgi:hypothetical protein
MARIQTANPPTAPPVASFFLSWGSVGDDQIAPSAMASVPSNVRTMTNGMTSHIANKNATAHPLVHVSFALIAHCGFRHTKNKPTGKHRTSVPTNHDNGIVPSDAEDRT